MPGKVIERVLENCEEQVGDGHSEFRKGSCVNQIFVLRQVCEKMKEKIEWGLS